MRTSIFLEKKKNLGFERYMDMFGSLRPNAVTETSLLYLICSTTIYFYIFLFFSPAFLLFLFFILFFRSHFVFLCDVIFLFSFFVFVVVVVVVFFFFFIVRCSCFHVKNLFAPLVFEEQVNLKFWLFQWNIVKLKKNYFKKSVMYDRMELD